MRSPIMSIILLALLASVPVNAIPIQATNLGLLIWVVGPELIHAMGVAENATVKEFKHDIIFLTFQLEPNEYYLTSIDDLSVPLEDDRELKCYGIVKDGTNVLVVNPTV